MAHALLGINSTTPQTAAALPPEKPFYADVVERIQAIWTAFCIWISDLIHRLVSLVYDAPQPVHITTLPPDPFRAILSYLQPEEILRSMPTNKAWKTLANDERVWQAQCKQQQVSYKLAPGQHKLAFTNPEPPIAFGPKEWRHHFGEPGIAPRLPASIHRTLAKLKESHTLTLIPATVNGQPLSFNTFAPLSEHPLQGNGMRLDITDEVSKKFGTEIQPKAIWVFTAKEIDPESRSITQADAAKKYQLGKALWITVSVVAHYVRSNICLFPHAPTWTYTRTSDGGEDKYGAWYVVVGGSAPGVLSVTYRNYACGYLGVAGVVPAEVLA